MSSRFTPLAHKEDETEIVLVVPSTDVQHTADSPFYDDLICPCHEDAELIEEVTQQIKDGLLTAREADRRRSIIGNVQRLIIDDAPSAWIYNSLLFYAQRKWVKGWVLYPSGNWYFYPVQKSL